MPPSSRPADTPNGRRGRIRATRRASSLTVIVGGLGAVGQMLRRELADDLDRIVEIDPRSGRASADIKAPGALERDLLEHADTVVLAVHEQVALAALPRLAELLRADDVLLVQTLSVQTRFAAAVEREQPSCEVIGINPMFGPSLTMAGRTVAVVPLRAGQHEARFT